MAWTAGAGSVRATSTNRRTDVSPRTILLGKAIALLTVAGVAISLSACGSGDDTATAADAEAKAEKARLRLEQCLRENGVDIKTSDGGRRTEVRATPKDRGAMEKCRKYQEQAFGSITPEQRQEFQDAATKFAACMREHGVDMPDPVMGGGPGAGGGPQTRRSPGANGTRIDRDSPKTQAAMKACEDKLPKGPGGRVRFGGGPAKAP
jgi:hypothetical protein